MKRHIPTMHQGFVEIELISFDEVTKFSSFRITTNAFVTTEIMLSGKTIKELYNQSCSLINDRINKEQ